MTQPPKSAPKDAQVMMTILNDMGVTEYEPRIINQMLEFSYRYISDVLEDAKVYSVHFGKKNIDTEDVRVAVQSKLDHSFTNPPPRDLLLDVARHKNSTPLPLIKPFTGPKLPPDRYCLTSTNYRLSSAKKNQIQSHFLRTSTTTPRLMTGQPFSGLNRPSGLVASSAAGGALANRGYSQPKINIKPATAQTRTAVPSPVFRFLPGSSVTSSAASSAISTSSFAPIQQTTMETMSLKRKREEDDDYDV